MFVEEVAMGAEALEGPGQIGLDGHALSPTSRDDAKQDTRVLPIATTRGNTVKFTGFRRGFHR